MLNFQLEKLRTGIKPEERNSSIDENSNAAEKTLKHSSQPEVSSQEVDNLRKQLQVRVYHINL